jgi:hypothetical protein
MAKCKTGQVWDRKVRKCIADKSSLETEYKSELGKKGIGKVTRKKGTPDPRFSPKRGKSRAVAKGIASDSAKRGQKRKRRRVVSEMKAGDRWYKNYERKNK